MYHGRGLTGGRAGGWGRGGGREINDWTQFAKEFCIGILHRRIPLRNVYKTKCFVNTFGRP